MTAQALKFYSIGLMAYSAVKIIVPVYYALDDTRWPVIGSFLSVAANVVIILFTLQRFQHRAIALSTSVTIIFNFLFLAWILYRKTGGYPVGRLFAAFLKIAAASAVMAAAVYFVSLWTDLGQNTAGLAVQVSVSILAGIIVYVAGILIIGLEEARDILRAVIRLFRKAR